MAWTKADKREYARKYRKSHHNEARKYYKDNYSSVYTHYGDKFYGERKGKLVEGKGQETV